MLIRLISLAILLLLIDTNHISLADENFILPKDKPSVFKKIEKPRTSSKDLLPQSKPIIKTDFILKSVSIFFDLHYFTNSSSVILDISSPVSFFIASKNGTFLYGPLNSIFVPL